MRKVAWRAEIRGVSYPYNPAIIEVSSAPPCSIRGQKLAAVRLFITHTVKKVLVRRGKARLVTTLKAHSTAVTTGVQVCEPTPLHIDDVCKGSRARDDGHEEAI